MHELKRIVELFTSSSCISSVICKMKEVRCLVFACISQGQDLGLCMYLRRLGFINQGFALFYGVHKCLYCVSESKLPG